MKLRRTASSVSRWRRLPPELLWCSPSPPAMPPGKVRSATRWKSSCREKMKMAFMAMMAGIRPSACLETSPVGHRAYKTNGFPWVFVGRVPSRGVSDEFSNRLSRFYHAATKAEPNNQNELNVRQYQRPTHSLSPNSEVEPGRRLAMGSARRWRAVFRGSRKTSFHKLSSTSPERRMGHDGLGEPPKPAREPRALPDAISEFGLRRRGVGACRRCYTLCCGSRMKD